MFLGLLGLLGLGFLCQLDLLLGRFIGFIRFFMSIKLIINGFIIRFNNIL